MFLPLGDDNTRRRTTPILVWVIFGINAFVWILQLTIGEPFTYGYSAVPYEITRGEDLVQAQMIRVGQENLTIPQFPGPTPIYLTLITAMFMHGSWMHIIGNMVYLLVFGDQIEDLLGRLRFVVFYLVCGLAAGAAHILVGTDSMIPSLGASGAIAGVLGAYLVKYPKNSVRVLVVRFITRLPAYVVLGGWIALQLVSQVGVAAGQTSGVAYMAHIGGFLAGAALIFLMAKSRPAASGGHRRRPRRRRY